MLGVWTKRTIQLEKLECHMHRTWKVLFLWVVCGEITKYMSITWPTSRLLHRGIRKNMGMILLACWTCLIKWAVLNWNIVSSHKVFKLFFQRIWLYMFSLKMRFYCGVTFYLHLKPHSTWTFFNIWRIDKCKLPLIMLGIKGESWSKVFLKLVFVML